MAFHVRTKNGRYTENMKCETNVALDCKNEILDRRDELKIKHDYFSIFGEKEGKYIIPTGAVCLTPTARGRYNRYNTKKNSIKWK